MPQANRANYYIFYLKVFLVTIIVSSLAVLAIFLVTPKSKSNPTSSKVLPSLKSLPSKQKKVAPSFVLSSLTSPGSTSLSSYKGKVLVLNFWASWCTACKAEAPLLTHISNIYQAKGVQFLGVDVSDKNTPALAFRSKYKINYPSVVDPQAKVASTYGVFGLPSTFIINKAGIIKYQIIGEIGSRSFTKALNQVIKTGR